ncbi:MAG: ribonuclease P protein component [Candidatus Methylomirabilales bacterium]
MIRGSQKVSWKGVSLFIHRHPGPERRLGLAVSARLGTAVARNRTKRRLRECFRLHRGQMPEGLDLVVVVHRDFSEAGPEAFQGILGELFRRTGLFQDLPPRHGQEFVQTSS